MDQPVAPDEAAVGPAERPSPVELRQVIELLFFAYRDFTGEADAMLARYGFGRAHHRVIYFIGRDPGLGVGDLLAILKISKQALSPVLGQLVREGFVVQRRDPEDRRRRRLFLTVEAAALERKLTERQSMMLIRAYHRAGRDAVDGFTRVLAALINPSDCDRLPAAPVSAVEAGLEAGASAGRCGGTGE